jgi:glutamate-1-semialdehyde 2,1-aminomutase
MTTDRNQQLFERAQQHIPGGVNSPVRAFRAVGGTPRFITRGEGAYIWDANGTRYIDYIGSWGPMILGHAHAEIVAAVQQAATRSLSFGAPTEDEIVMAEEICARMPSVEMVRLVSSGTEAAMSALRLARGYTGRDFIVKFEGCYHGHADSLLVKAGSGLATFGHPNSGGVPADLAKYTLVLPYNDTQALADLFAKMGDQIACVMVEPIAGNMNFVRGSREFLGTMRELCTRHGALCIWDEVMSGFRVALGGAQSVYGITPDMTAMGKVIGGGMPLAAFGGKREVMQKLSPLGNVYQAGTLSGNPVAVAAGLANLRLISQPGFFEALTAKTQTLVAGLKAAAAEAGVPFSADSEGGKFGFFFRASLPQNYTEVMDGGAAGNERFNRFFHAMLGAGVYLAPALYEAGFVSAAHSQADLDHTVEAARAAMRTLKPN